MKKPNLLKAVKCISNWKFQGILVDFNYDPKVPFPWGSGYWPVSFSSDEALQIAGLFHQGQFAYCSGLRQSEPNIFQISTWKAFLLLKIYLLWKIRPISLKRWKTVCGSVPAQFPGPIVHLVNLQQLAIFRLNVGMSDWESRTFFIKKFITYAVSSYGYRYANMFATQLHKPGGLPRFSGVRGHLPVFRGNLPTPLHTNGVS